MSELHSVSPEGVLTPGGRLRSVGETGLDRGFLAASHLWPLIGALTATLPLMILLPIVLWIARKNDSPLIDDQGREIMNVALTFGVLLLVPVLGWLVLLVWGPVWIVSSIRAAIATQDGQYFRYPMTLRFIQ